MQRPGVGGRRAPAPYAPVRGPGARGGAVGAADLRKPPPRPRRPGGGPRVGRGQHRPHGRLRAAGVLVNNAGLGASGAGRLSAARAAERGAGGGRVEAAAEHGAAAEDDRG
ncbi:hypothetical protein [Streptomyces rimosus]|uniref:hypothetical protein n=1 Tax=Streptomyces rimosus TaxID=1927 RepID=UPI001ADD9AF5|nr:hypothetical protein [Streptomyces rimosus]